MKIKKYNCNWKGIPCTEEESRQWEDLEKNNLGYRRKAITKIEEFIEGEWADISVINDETLDADGEIVLPSGCDLSRFQKNPVIMFNHDYDSDPIGRAAWVVGSPKSNPTQIKMKSIYAPRPKDYPREATWRPEEVWGLIRGNFLPGKSVGYIATESRMPTPQEIAIRPELIDCKKIITQWQLIEVSVCPIPCNENALTEAVAQSFKSLGIPPVEVKKIELPKPKVCHSWKHWERQAMNYFKLNSTELYERLHGLP